MKNIQKKLLLPLAILIGLTPLANPLNIFNDLRLFAFDTLQQISPREPLEDDPVVIIDIDDESQSERFMDKDWETETIFPTLKITDKSKKEEFIEFNGGDFFSLEMVY